MAVKSFSGFVHVIRDQMMDDDTVQHSFVFTGGWLEDEMIHHKEQVRVIAEAKKIFPHSRTQIQLDGALEDFVNTANQGNAALAAYIRKGYSRIPSLFYNNKHGNLRDDFEQLVDRQNEDLRQLKQYRKGCTENPNRMMPSYVPPPSIQIMGHSVPTGLPATESVGGIPMCGPGWKESTQKRMNYIQRRIDFLNDKSELERMRQYYRQMLSQWGITPEELKQSEQ